MKVQMDTKIGGTRNGVDWPEVGGEIDVPEYEAADLIAAGFAHAVDSQPETAEAPAEGETAEAPRPATAKRPAKRASK